MMTKKLSILLALLILSGNAFAELKVVKWECSEEPTGIVQNTDSKNYRYVQIQIPLLKKDGTKVGDAVANVSGLGPNQKWEFKGLAFNKSFDQCGAPKVTGFQYQLNKKATKSKGGFFYWVFCQHSNADWVIVLNLSQQAASLLALRR